MSETHATHSAGAPVFPPGRYGRRREPRRRPVLTALLGLALVAALGTIVVRMYQQYGDPEYDANVITYTDITDSQVLIDFQVTVPRVAPRCVCCAPATGPAPRWPGNRSR